jgi:hypothetical protein
MEAEPPAQVVERPGEHRPCGEIFHDARLRTQRTRLRVRPWVDASGSWGEDSWCVQISTLARACRAGS